MPALARAAELGSVPWTIVAKESTLGFKATMEGQEAEGALMRFGGVIQFDKDHLDQSRIDIEIDMASVSGAHEDMPTILKNASWFDVAHFPKARFAATKMRAGAKGGYFADGTVTLRNVGVPVTVSFHFDAYGPKAGQKPGEAQLLRAVARGSATLSRTAFGVGQGEWRSTDTVADPVEVHFTIVAEKPAGD